MTGSRLENAFQLVSEYEPAGDQPAAIDALCEGMLRGDKHQTLLGVTGSGKTFSVACMIERLNRLEEPWGFSFGGSLEVTDRLYRLD